jgi:hypothetical protein
MDVSIWKEPSESVSLSIPHMPSLESSPKLELEPILDNLKSLFLGTDDTLSVIIAYELPKIQENSLLGMLEEHKETTEIEKFP